jgi:predicted house-cleaning noncanonical NTP pyrophosphatase (MazG superfamily)
MQYNKLVRDHIPAIIQQHGETPITRTLEPDEYQDALRRKLHEEVAEFCTTGHIDELADILEVVYALAAVDGVSPAHLEAVRQHKLQERGGFHRRLLLVETQPAQATRQIARPQGAV